jgi:Ran GTPase-activating protein 1
MAASGILSWQGRGLKLDTKEQVEELLKDVDPTKITEIHLGGNTFGVDASVAFAEFLAKTTQLKVRLHSPYSHHQG